VTTLRSSNQDSMHWWLKAKSTADDLAGDLSLQDARWPIYRRQDESRHHEATIHVSKSRIKNGRVLASGREILSHLIPKY
jgi:hypothetical protein